MPEPPTTDEPLPPALRPALPAVPLVRRPVRRSPFPRRAGRAGWRDARPSSAAGRRRAQPSLVVGPAGRPDHERLDARMASPLCPDRGDRAGSIPLPRPDGFLRVRQPRRGRGASVPADVAGRHVPAGLRALGHGAGTVRRPARAPGPASPGNWPHGAPARGLLASCRWPSSIRSGMIAAPRSSSGAAVPWTSRADAFDRLVNGRHWSSTSWKRPWTGWRRTSSVAIRRVSRR